VTVRAKLSRTVDRVLDNTLAIYIVLGIIIIGMISPLVLMTFTAFKSPAEAEQWPPTIFPHDLDLGSFKHVFFYSHIPIALRNSLIVTLSTVFIVILVAMPTAYGLARYKYRGSKIFSYLLLATRIVPPISLMVPFFAIFANLHLINSRLALIILNVYLNYPIVTWLLMGTFREFPSDLIGAAMIDGCTRTRTFLHVVLPLTRPAISAGAIITFMFTWNEFLYALVFTQTQAIMPLTVGIFEFVGDEVIEWTRLCAVGVLTSLPSILFFIFAQRHIVQGLTAGAIKGGG